MNSCATTVLDPRRRGGNLSSHGERILGGAVDFSCTVVLLCDKRITMVKGHIYDKETGTCSCGEYREEGYNRASIDRNWQA